MPYTKRCYYTVSAFKRFNSHVGIGSRGHDFDGVVRSRVKISRSDTGANEDSGGTRLLAMTGGGAAAVDSRMLLMLTLFLKNCAKSTEVSSGADSSFGGRSTLLTVCQG